MPEWSPLTPYVMLTVGSTVVLFEGVVLVALYRVGMKNPTFVLFFVSGASAFVNTINYASLHFEYITGLHSPFTEVANSRWVNFSARVPGTAVYFLYVVVAFNRAHAIIFPLHYRGFWTKRLIIFISLIVYTSSCVLAYYGTFFDDPRVLAIHNLDSLCFFIVNYSGQALGSDWDREWKGKATNYNVIIGYASDITAVVYGALFVRFGWNLVKRKILHCGVDSVSILRETKDHIRLMMICFGFSVLPQWISVYVLPFITFSPVYRCIATDLVVMVIYGSESLFLFFFSSLVKQYMPFREYILRKLENKRAPSNVVAPMVEIGISPDNAPRDIE